MKVESQTQGLACVGSLIPKVAWTFVNQENIWSTKEGSNVGPWTQGLACVSILITEKIEDIN